MTTFIPARCRRSTTPVARSPPPRTRTRAGLLFDIRCLCACDLLRGIQCPKRLFPQHVAERIKQEKNKQEEECVKQGESRQAHARVNDNSKDLHGGLGRVL